MSAPAESASAGGGQSLVARARQFQARVVQALVQAELRYHKLLDLLQSSGCQPQAQRGDSPVRILIVDDEPGVLLLLEEILARPDRQLLTVGDAETALAAFAQQPCDVLITDKNMPGMNGVDLLRQVKARRPETAGILITAYASKEVAIEVLNLGAEALLEKPFMDLDSVQAAIERVIAKQQKIKNNMSYLQVIRSRHEELLEAHKALDSELAVAERSGRT